jgi:3-oxoadipate enol-lactonase
MDSNKLKSLVAPCSVAARRVDVGDLTMNVVVAGAGRPIVLIHGLGWDHTLWGRQIERLKEHYRVVAGDTRGHGETDKPDGTYSIKQFTADWEALLERLATGPALIVGFSLGGMIAQRLALVRPDLVGALVLVNTTCTVPSSGREHMDGRLAAMKAKGARAAAELAASSVFSEAWRDAHPEQLAEFIEWRAAQDQNALRAVMHAASDFDISAELSQLNVPALVVTALGDTLMVPAAQAPLATLIPGAKQVHVPQSGHMLPIENAIVFDSILDDFLAQHWHP